MVWMENQSDVAPYLVLGPGPQMMHDAAVGMQGNLGIRELSV